MITNNSFEYQTHVEYAQNRQTGCKIRTKRGGGDGKPPSCIPTLQLSNCIHAGLITITIKSFHIDMKRYRGRYH